MPGGKSFIAILLAVFVDVIGFSIIVPILPFLTMFYGGDAFDGALLVAVYSLATFLGGPLWGRLSDKIGRRPTLIATFIAGIAAHILLAFSTSLLIVFVARGLAGLMAGNIGIAMAATSDLTGPKDRGKALGFIGAAFGLAFAIGPGIGVMLSGDPGTPNIFWPGIVSASSSLLAATFIFLWFPETLEKTAPETNVEMIYSMRQSYRMIICPASNFLLLLMIVLTSSIQSANFFLTPFWANAVLGWSQYEVGFFLMGAGLMVAIIQTIVTGPMFRVFGEVKSLAIGNVTQIIGCFILLQDSGSYQAFLGLPLIIAGLTITFPAVNSLISQRTSKTLHGTALGLSSGLTSLGRLLGPLVTASLFERFTPTTPYIMIGAVGIIVIIWSFWDMGHHSHRMGDEA